MVVSSKWISNSFGAIPCAQAWAKSMTNDLLFVFSENQSVDIGKWVNLKRLVYMISQFLALRIMRNASRRDFFIGLHIANTYQ